MLKKEIWRKMKFTFWVVVNSRNVQKKRGYIRVYKYIDISLCSIVVVSWFFRCQSSRFVHRKADRTAQLSVKHLSFSLRPELSFTGWTLVGYYHVVSSTDNSLSALSLSSHSWYSYRGHIDPYCLDTVILFYMLWESRPGNCPCRDICHPGLSMLIHLLMSFIDV